MHNEPETGLLIHLLSIIPGTINGPKQLRYAGTLWGKGAQTGGEQFFLKFFLKKFAGLILLILPLPRFKSKPR